MKLINCIGQLGKKPIFKKAISFEPMLQPAVKIIYSRTKADDENDHF